VVISLLGYFLYLLTTFTAAMALLISFDDSRLISHHSAHSATVGLAIVATRGEDRHLAAMGQSQSASAKDVKSSRNFVGTEAESKAPKSSHSVALAKTETKKNERKRFARLDAMKVLAHFGMALGSSEGHGFRMALGYAEGSGYRPGLDSQR
jgi:hypothetical protein